MLVTIREADCIGCTKCIQACPVDAILGSMNQMHTVIAAECIGCKLCIAPCPVDCIELHDIKPEKNKELTLKRVKARKLRLSGDELGLINTGKDTGSRGLRHGTTAIDARGTTTENMHDTEINKGSGGNTNVQNTLARIKALKSVTNKKSIT